MIRRSLFYSSAIALACFLFPFVVSVFSAPLSRWHAELLVDAFYESWAAIHFDFNWFGSNGPIAVFVLLVLLCIASGEWAD